MKYFTLAAALAASLAFAGAAHAQYNGVSPQGGFGHAEDSNAKAPPYPADKDTHDWPAHHQASSLTQQHGAVSPGTGNGSGAAAGPAKNE
jgi:hypothetical protein